MKQMRNMWAVALFLGLVLPWVMINAAGNYLGLYVTVPVTEPTETGLSVPYEDITIDVLRNDGQTQPMALEEYLVGVVLGEMPASFEMEALKAQAVVARTYTLRRHFEAYKHTAGSVCTDPACCQAYCAPEAYLAEGGEQAALDRVAGAVAQTAGLVLTYEGKLIEATYFASSGGRTEAAVEVWGRDLPYLQAVDSPEGVYEDKTMATVTMSAADFRAALNLDLSGSPGTWVRAVTYTDGGGVDTMNIGGTTFSGTELRKLLNLRSTAFVITGVGDTVTITTRGHGHRVGMSQYGAESMALEGCAFNEILSHYYQDTKLEDYIDIVGDLG